MSALAPDPGRLHYQQVIVALRPANPTILVDECVRLFAVARGLMGSREALGGRWELTPYAEGYLAEAAPRTADGRRCQTP